MKFFVILVCVLAFAQPVDAHVPILVSKESPLDITTIADPALSQAFYGSMDGFPHTFEIKSEVPFRLFTQILLPDIASSLNNVSGVIVKLPLKEGRVTEVGQLVAATADWKSEFEPFGGDSYRQGPVFDAEMEPGTYHIEVHTLDNLEKYVLVVGTREEMSIGFFETVKRLVGVKLFFDKSPIRVIESMFVYGPLVLVGGIGFLIWYVRRRRKVVIE